MVTDGNKRLGKGGDTGAEGTALTVVETVGQGYPVVFIDCREEMKNQKKDVHAG